MALARFARADEFGLQQNAETPWSLVRQVNAPTTSATASTAMTMSDASQAAGRISQVVGLC